MNTRDTQLTSQLFQIHKLLVFCLRLFGFRSDAVSISNNKPYDYDWIASIIDGCVDGNKNVRITTESIPYFTN